jgi:hypothetical protein
LKEEAKEVEQVRWVAQQLDFLKDLQIKMMDLGSEHTLALPLWTTNKPCELFNAVVNEENYCFVNACMVCSACVPLACEVRYSAGMQA